MLTKNKIQTKNKKEKQKIENSFKRLIENKYPFIKTLNSILFSNDNLKKSEKPLGSGSHKAKFIHGRRYAHDS